MEASQLFTRFNRKQ